MPRVPFPSLPASARVWVFASDAALVDQPADHLLAGIDQYLDSWKAHGTPLRCARDWLEDRFLIVGVDPTVEQVSGCSIDGLFRVLRRLEYEIDSRLVGGGRVFYRDRDRRPAVATPDEFHQLVASGVVTPTTPVFDTTLGRLGEWRAKFELPLPESWARNIVPPNGAGTD